MKKLDFYALSKEDGIIFSYDERKKAVYVRRDENNNLLIQKGKAEDINKLLNRNSLLEFFEDNIRLFYIGIILILDIAFELLKVPLTHLMFINILIFMTLIIYTILQIVEAKMTPQNEKQYHAAEHKVINSLGIVKDIKTLRKFSSLSNTCGQNAKCINIVCYITTVIICNSKCTIELILNQIKMYENSRLVYKIFLFIISYGFIIIVDNKINELSKEKGIFNNMVQKCTVAEPTDEQLELAMKGYKLARELDKKTE